MSKRFTDTVKWQKKWFRGLSPIHKCFWLYLCDTCNHAGIWEVDFDLASFFLGEKITAEEVKEPFKKQFIETEDGKKWFIKDFVDFQYGELNPENRAHLSVINILKKEGAFKGLKQSLQGRKDKDKDKDKDMDKDMDKDKEGDSKGKHTYGEFKKVLLTDEEYQKLKDKLNSDAEKWIKTLDEGIAYKGYKYKSHYLAILKWVANETKKESEYL